MCFFMIRKIFLLFLLSPFFSSSQTFTLVENSGILPIQRSWDMVSFQDIDGDGDLDLFTGGAHPWATVGRMYKNDGDGNFSIHDDQTFIKKREGGLAFGDVNGDGSPDMIVSGGYGNPGGSLTKLYFNNGIGNFTLSETSSFPNVYQGDIRMFDFDNDNDLDILISGMLTGTENVLHLYENNGNGVFTLRTQTGLEQYGLNYGSVVIEDFNNDGNLDIATNGRLTAANSSSKTRIFLNNGNGIFTLMTQPAFDYISAGTIVVGDVDNNGSVDLVFSGSGTGTTDNPNGFKTELFLNDGNGIFTLSNSNSFIGHIDFPSIVLTDINNDNSLDLITMGRIGMDPATYATYLYINNGLGNFTLTQNTPFTGYSNGKISIADVDNDGDKDILITGYSGFDNGIAKLYLNDVANLSTNEIISQKFKIYPNPVTDILNIEMLSEDQINAFEIYNIEGRLILQSDAKESSISSIDVSTLKTGIYILSLKNNRSEIHKMKFTKK
ncbi:T9SS C-terminal target domain-containing protein [Paenimyroides tangerinum]|uniref:T9SS C-terminal target domain-containing protein n=2 Tax=Paenimyroides tangerinum TaxID=2488728 RepID=A0A3P3WDG5_9FLAO|nr:T9SS C-terminal target domain-containing protein [Paenimyroides tangerinum]